VDFESPAQYELLMNYWRDAGIRIYDFWVKPLTLNHAYFIVGSGKQALTKEGRVYKKFIDETIAMTDAYHGRAQPDASLLEFTYIYLFPHTPDPLPKGVKSLPKHQQTVLRKRQHDYLFFGNGKLQPKDVTNYFKLIEDSFATAFGIDDKHNITVHGYKRPHDYKKPRVIVLVSEVEYWDTDIVHGGQHIEWDKLNELRPLIEE
jgi:hypothetical protein